MTHGEVIVEGDSISIALELKYENNALCFLLPNVHDIDFV